jgi:nucleoside-diphosphate-sugar epimerase
MTYDPGGWCDWIIGNVICERLRADGQPVRALIRRTSNPDKVHALRSLGCELSIGDLKNPHQIHAACQGISAVIATASSTLSRQPGNSIESVDLQGQLALANAARDAGVQRFIYTGARPVSGRMTVLVPAGSVSLFFWTRNTPNSRLSDSKTGSFYGRYPASRPETRAH